VKTTHHPDAPYEPKTAWGRFWFRPTDPTTLGFMRVMTGLVVLYVHLAYCFDFKSFFGTEGWLDQKAANRERKESPIIRYRWDWAANPNEDFRPAIVTPQIHDRRVAVFDFLKHLPEAKAERDAALAYLYYLLDQGARSQAILGNSFQKGLLLVRDAAALLDEQREKMEAGLARDQIVVKDLPLSVPEFFLQMGPDDRLRLWRDCLRLCEYIPDERTLNFNYVLEWMLEMGPGERYELAKFLRDLPDGPESRRVIEYFEMWRVDPRQTYDQGRYVFSLWFHISDPTTMWVCHGLIIVVIVMFTLGLFTRVTSVLTWMAALCYIHRTQQVLFGMDTMMNILLFYLMIGPSGAALSLDRLIERYRAARAIRRAGGQPVPWAEAVLAGPRPSVMANFVIRLAQIHFCMMYMSSGLSKLKGQMWWNTTAAWMTIANPEFCPMHFQAYQWMIRELANARPLLNLVYAAVVYGTLVLEIGLPILVWTRARPYVVIGAIFLHAGIAAVMGLTCFGLLMMCLLLSYVPAAVVRDRLTWASGSGPRLILRTRAHAGKPLRLVAFLRALDVANQITVQEDPKLAENAVELVDDHGHVHTGYDLYQTALNKLVLVNLIGWVFWVPGVSLLLRSLLGVPAPSAGAPPRNTPLPGMGKKPAAS
jgi:hypothetical protein